MAHEMWELKQKQSLPLKAKIQMTITRVREWYEYWINKGEDVYLSWSGGKDSTVLKHIIDTNLPYYHIKSVYFDTGLEYPEIKEFVKKDPNVVILHPTKPFWQVVRDYGYPVISKEVSECVCNARKHLNRGGYDTHYRKLCGIGEYQKKTENIPDPPQRVQKLLGTLKTKDKQNKSAYNMEKWYPLINAPFNISNKCCSIMKKNPAHKYNKENKAHPITAEMAEESRLRLKQWLRNGCNGFDMKEPKSTPMSFWTEQDVLQYIKEFNVEIPSVYGQVINDNDLIDGFEQLTLCDIDCKLKTTGCNRTGCMFCLYGAHLEKGKSRFERLKETHPKIYEYCIGGGEFVDGIWQPNRKGLGLGYVMDYINNLYGKKMLRY